jgi:hypothetical protein
MPNVNNIDEITQQANSGNQDNNQNNNNQNNNNQNNSTSKQVVLGCDRNGHDDSNYQSTVASIIEQAGYTVEKLEIEPNAFASYSYDGSKAKGKIGIYLIAAGTYSIGDATYGNTSFDYNYFGIRPECSPNWEVEDFDKKPIGSDPDTQGGVTDKIAGKTFKEINDIVKERSMVVTGKDATEMGNNLVAAMGGQVQGGQSGTTGGGAVSIPDKTFYGLIKQMIGAIDGLFIIANNMAYLLSFKDFYEYRDQYDQYIPKIERKDVIYDSIVRNWTTDGYYNSVEVTYADGIIKYQNDALVQQYGENTFYYNFPDDDEETAKAKADALLGAHIRDYSTEIELSVFYNENITVGSWVKLHKSLSKLSGKTHRDIVLEQQKQPISSKHNGIDITNLIEKTITQNNITKTIQTITDKEGNKFDIEIDKSEYELFFVQSFTCRWDKDNALIMDLVLKYGPDTPEDPVNATIGTGQAMSGGGGQSSGGMYGSDCFAANSSSVSGFTENPPSDLLQGRANQNAQYAKDVAGKSPEEAFNFMNSKFPYCYYEDNCATYKCVTDWYDSNPPGANCADSACLIVSVMNSIGVKACVVHVPGHYFNQIELNGKWVTCDMVDSEHSKDNSNTAGFPVNYCGGRVSCPCASNGGRTS